MPQIREQLLPKQIAGSESVNGRLPTIKVANENHHFQRRAHSILQQHSSKDHYSHPKASTSLTMSERKQKPHLKLFAEEIKYRNMSKVILTDKVEKEHS